MALAWQNWVNSDDTVVVLDGGLGMMLLRKGHDLCSLWSGKLLISGTEELAAIGLEWLKAGADIISTATYQVSFELIQKEFNLDEQESCKAIRNGWSVLNETRAIFWQSLEKAERSRRRFPKIALSLGPYSAVHEDGHEYTGMYEKTTNEQLRLFHLRRTLIFKDLCKGGNEDDPDIVAFETIGCISEAVAIAKAMNEVGLHKTIYWICFQCRNSRQIASGEFVADAAAAVLRENLAKNLVGVGANCFNLKQATGLVEVFERCISESNSGESQKNKTPSTVTTIVYPNSGEVFEDDVWSWPTGEEICMINWADIVLKSRAKIIGGCCRVGPEHVRELDVARRADNTKRSSA